MVGNKNVGHLNLTELNSLYGEHVEALNKLWNFWNLKTLKTATYVGFLGLEIQGGSSSKLIFGSSSHAVSFTHPNLYEPY